MPLNNRKPARNDLYQDIQYIRKDIVFGDNGKVIQVGTLPAHAVIMKAISGVNVSTVFNAATTNALKIGTAADDDLFGTDLALGVAGLIPLDEAVSEYVAVDTEITATVALSGTAATTGVGQIIIAYCTRN
ncbi:hypothetical protein LH464_21335 [Neorhizobium sp. T786]|uniref:hypothetical protein n=1 Tax=Pseudorhizobium xiangyangii TaxID=2883104 RepID=UPI001CFFA0B3|nr:hypothetical protein [Neorhizobium xiangyangii]MCB5205013.1 hypothetical protein [Neorhizobium xiangyangii]